MRNKKILLGMLVCTLTFIGCSTMHYRAESSVPIKEQCILKLGGSGPRVLTFNGKPVNWSRLFFYSSVCIPAGKNSLSVSVNIPINSRTSGNTTYTTYLTGTVNVEYEFEPGGTYHIESHYNRENQIWATIEKDFEGEAVPRSVIAAPEIYWWGISAGMDYISAFKIDPFSVQFGGIFDTDILSIGLFLDVSLFGFGVGAGTNSGLEDEWNNQDISTSSSIGISSEFYFPGKSFGFGIGGGLYSNFFGSTPVAPYLRAIVVPYKGSTKLVTYFDYYLPDIKPYDDSWFSKYGGKSFTTNKWGLGLAWYFM